MNEENREVDKHSLRLEALRDQDRSIRGEIIYAAIFIESVIEEIIAYHFCDESKHPAFISLIFLVGQITFSQKLIIVKKLLKDSYPELLSVFPRIFNQLEKIRELRNKLAHSKMGFHPTMAWEISKASTKSFNGTTLEYYKDGKIVSEFISRIEIDNLLDRASLFGSVLTYLKEEIKSRSLGVRNQNFKLAMDSLQHVYPEMFKLLIQ